MRAPELEAAARRVLAAPPAPPRDPTLFTTGVCFGQPGIYPGHAPMAPAPGRRPDEAALVSELTTFAAAGGGDFAVLRQQFVALAPRCPDPLPRAALAVLATTLAAPLVAAFPTGTSAHTLSLGVPASAGRVVGPALPRRPDARVVNERYQAEHPALIASSLAHALLWSPEFSFHAGEALLHALNAMVHLQLVARVPELAHRGTELCRRQNSLAITLCNSRRPGSERITLVAPDGPGTIPGGDPPLQSTDFWSVPFGPQGDGGPPAGLRDLARDVFGPLTEDTGEDRPFAATEAWGRWFGERLSGTWLPPIAHLRAALALGLVGVDDIVTASGRKDAADDPRLADAIAVWKGRTYE